MPTFTTPQPISVEVELVVGEIRIIAADRSDTDVDVRPGDIVETVVSYAAPHHVNADGPLLSHRRTRAGDAFATPRPVGVALGMPKIGAPA